MCRIPAIGRVGPLYLPNKAILVRTPPCEPISMPQDDSKQWEHLLSQESDPSWADFELLNLQSISLQSRRPRAHTELPKKATRAAEGDEHENGRSWALIPSTGAGEHSCELFNLQKCFLGKKVTLLRAQPCRNPMYEGKLVGFMCCEECDPT